MDTKHINAVFIHPPFVQTSKIVDIKESASSAVAFGSGIFAHAALSEGGVENDWQR